MTICLEKFVPLVLSEFQGRHNLLMDNPDEAKRLL